MTGKQLKNSILQWAIQGKLVPQDPNDEPASVLLEKIRAEKARLIKEGKIKKDKKESIIYRGEDNSYYEKFADGKVVCIDEEIPFEIPQKWVWCRLNNLADIVRGGSPRPAGSPEYYNGNIPFLKVADLTKDSQMFVRTYTATIKEAGLKKTRMVSANTLLLTNSGATLGVPKICTFETTFNDGIAAFLYLTEELKPYLYWFLCAMTDIFRNINQGTAQPNLNTDIIKETLFAVPPIAEQRRIINKIEELSPIIDKYSLAQNKLSQLNSDIYACIKKSILYEAIQGRLVPQDASEEPATILLQRFKEEKLRLVKEGKLKKKDVIDSTIFRGDDNKYFEKKGKEVACIDDEIPFGIPESWQWCRINTICNITNGFTPLRTEDRFWRNGDINWFTVEDIRTQGEYINYTSQKISKEATTPDRIVRPGSTLLCCTASVGQCAFTNIPTTTNQQFNALTIKDDYRSLMTDEYLFLFAKTLKDELHRLSGKTTFEFISIKKVGNLLVPIPPFNEQKRIVAIVNKSLASIMSRSMEIPYK